MWEKRLACGSGTEHGCSAFASLCQPTWGKREIRTSRRTRDRKDAGRLIKAEASLPEEEFERHRRERDKQRHQGFWSCGGSMIQADPDSDEDRKQAPKVLREDPGGLGNLDDPRTCDEIAQDVDESQHRPGPVERVSSAPCPGTL